MGLYFAALAVLFIGIIVSNTVKETWKMKACAASSGISAALLLIPSLYVLFTGNELNKSFYMPPFFQTVDFIIDPLSAFFILIVSFMCFLGALYASGYIKPYTEKNMHISFHCTVFMLLEISMLAAAAVQNALFFLFAWEIMSLSSFFLVMFEHDKSAVRAAGIKYMIYMHLSIIFLMAAFAFLSLKTGSYSFYDYIKLLAEKPEYIEIVFILSFLGFGIKAGFIPFHNWLPDAHPAAPSHISGIMSGVMIKMGIYGILRMLYITGGTSKFAAYAILIVSVISALWGVLYAISKHDIKQLLAYHSIENIGIIGIGIGIGLLGGIYNYPAMAALGFAGAVLHILNHAVFKPLLFFAAGSIYKKTHTRDIEQLGGLIKKMPYTSLFFITGSIAICALPPFNGFISEFFIYAAMITGLSVKNPAVFSILITSLAALAFVGTMAVLCFSKVIGVMILGNPRTKQAENACADNEKIMLIPMGALAVLTLVIGLCPERAVSFILSPVLMFIPDVYALSGLIKTAQLISFLFLIFLLILVFISSARLILNNKTRYHNTWGCGYNRITPKMQYTASSYADLFISAMRPFFKRAEHIKQPDEIFPEEAYYAAETEDIEEAYIIKPLIKLDERILSKFEKLQNGNMQQYILFGLIFLVIAAITAARLSL